MLVFGKNVATEVINSKTKIKKVFVTKNFDNKYILDYLRNNNIKIINIGCKCSNKAIIHANTVATSTIIIEYVSLSIPDRRSSFARSMPLVMKGNPGIMKSMEHMYPASCTKGILNIRIASLSRIAYIRHDADIETAIFMNSVK